MTVEARTDYDCEATGLPAERWGESVFKIDDEEIVFEVSVDDLLKFEAEGMAVVTAAAAAAAATTTPLLLPPHHQQQDHQQQQQGEDEAWRQQAAAAAEEVQERRQRRGKILSHHPSPFTERLGFRQAFEEGRRNNPLANLDPTRFRFLAT